MRLGIRRALYDERLGAVQHKIDERRGIAVEHDRIAGERRDIRGPALAVGAMAGDAVASAIASTPARLRALACVSSFPGVEGVIGRASLQRLRWGSCPYLSSNTEALSR